MAAAAVRAVTVADVADRAAEAGLAVVVAADRAVVAEDREAAVPAEFSAIPAEASATT